MNLSKKIFLLSIFIIVISVCGVYSANIHQNNDAIPVISNQTDEFGCCSIVLQIDGNHSLMSYRRDANTTADVFIEKVNWHGIPVIKQYKTDHGYFNHVIITNDGWVVGLGGIDDGSDSEICENITAKMITQDHSISKKELKKIQHIKTKYGRGHVVIKDSEGNYGFATPTKLKTGTLNPGQYISIPNDYSLSRGNNVTLPLDDEIKTMVELSQSDLYGVDRREIVTYDIHLGNESNTTNIYVSNEDGSYLGINYTDCIDNICFNNTTIKGSDIPIGPDYKKVGSITFEAGNSSVNNLILLLIIVGFVVFVGILFFILLKFVRYLRYHNRR